MSELDNKVPKENRVRYGIYLSKKAVDGKTSKTQTISLAFWYWAYKFEISSTLFDEVRHAKETRLMLRRLRDNFLD